MERSPARRRVSWCPNRSFAVAGRGKEPGCRFLPVRHGNLLLRITRCWESSCDQFFRSLPPPWAWQPSRPFHRRRPTLKPPSRVHGRRADVDGAIVTLFPGYTDMLRQEQYGFSSAKPVISRITKSGQSVGTVMLPLWGHVLTLPSGASDAWRPTIQNDASGSGLQNRGTFLRFGAGSQGSMLQLQNSTGSFRNLYSKQQFTIAFWIRFRKGGSIGGDGVNQSIVDSNVASGSNVGFSVWKHTDNKIYVGVSSGSSSGLSGSTNRIHFGSEQTITADGSWHWVCIQSAGPGTGTASITIDTSAPTRGDALPGLPLETDASYNLMIGALAAGSSSRGQFDLDNLFISDTVVSASDLARLYDFNPARTSKSLLWVAKSSETGSLSPDAISHLWAWWDFSSPRHPVTQRPLIYTSSDKTTAAANSGDLMGYVENRGGAHLKRFLSQSTRGQLPTWTAGTQNGRGSAHFSGSWNSDSSVSAPFSFNLSVPTPPTDKTWYCVCQQTSQGNPDGSDTGQVGSHLHNYSLASTIYCAIGGVYHTGSPLNFLEHLAPGGGNAPSQSTFTRITFSGETTPATAGTYAVSSSTFSGNVRTTFYCAATKLWLYYTGSNWALSSTLGGYSRAYWQTSTRSNIISAFAPKGTASGSAGMPVGTPAAGPVAWNVYHGQQSGSHTRVGVNGHWGAWVANKNPTAAMYWDNIGNDAHQNGGGKPSATQHFEFNGYIAEFPVFSYSLPDRVFYALMRRVQDEWAIQDMHLAD